MEQSVVYVVPGGIPEVVPLSGRVAVRPKRDEERRVTGRSQPLGLIQTIRPRPTVAVVIRHTDARRVQVRTERSLPFSLPRRP